MAGTETALVIVDSSSFDFSFQGDWKNTAGDDVVGRWSYLNTTRDSRDRLGNFTLSFEGFDATFVGGAPLPPYTTYPPSTITLDPLTDSPDAFTIPLFASDDPPYYLPWYKTPLLHYGSRLLVTYCVQTVIDYALITVGPDTSLIGKKLFIDDTDPQILYDGLGWERNNNPTVGFRVNIAMPAQNTSYQATQVGDSFRFTFLGTSATVFGLFSWTNLSSLVLQYELDGNITSAAYPIQRSDPRYIGKEPVHINVPFVSYDHLSPTTHQLKVTVKEISITTFRFDYITYAPAFATLASKLSSGNSTVFTPASPVDEGQLEVKVVVGSVIGGLALLAIAVGGPVWWNRRLNARTHAVQQRASNDLTDTQEACTGCAIISIPSGVSSHYSPDSPYADSEALTPYPSEKVSDFAPPSSSQNLFPYMGSFAPMSVVAYPAEKLPSMSSVLLEAPPNRTQADNNRVVTAGEHQAIMVTRSHTIDSSTNSSTLGTDSMNASSPTASSLTLANTGLHIGCYNDKPLVTIYETPVRPPSYASAVLKYIFL